MLFRSILKEKAIGQALDLDDCVSGSLCGKNVSIRAGSYEELHDADIMVMAFGRSRRPGETRLDMFDDSIKMANEVVSHLKQVDFRGIMISISNPADIICEYIRRQMDWQPSRCFCTGTSLETYRLLRVLSKATGYSRRSIHGFCMGEHGNSSFIVWSRIFIGGKPFLQLRRERPVLAEISLEDLQTQVKKAGDIEIDGKGCTEFGIANVAKMLISAIFHDQKLVWPCSTLLRGEYGQHDVAAGVPCVIGKNGVEEILEVELTDEEQAKFAASCDILRGFLDRAASLKNSVCIKLKPRPAAGALLFCLLVLCICLCSFRFRQFFDQYFVDAGAVHINNLEAVAIPQEVVAGSRDMPDIGNDETGHSIETRFFFQRQLIQIKEVFKFADRQ